MEIFGDAGFDVAAIMQHVQEIETQFATLREHLAEQNDEAAVAMLDSLKAKIEALNPAEFLKGEDTHA